MRDRIKDDRAMTQFSLFDPSQIEDGLKKAIEQSAQKILAARALYPSKSLAWLYSPETMPPELSAAHKENDELVDRAYGYKDTGCESDRVAFLFELHKKIIGKTA